MKDDFERELPDPSKMVPPSPGWSQTTLLAPGAHPTGPDNLNYFPTITPLPHGKIAATRSENGNIHVFYQANDSTIHNVVNHPGKGWTTDEGLIIGAGKAKPGAPLTAIAGGWDELRLFYATTGEMLASVYRDDRCGWAPSGCFCCYSISLRPLLTKRCPSCRNPSLQAPPLGHAVSGRLELRFGLF
jgi:hypothetical protein